MNAVTTAEYVVLDEIVLDTFVQKLNVFAKQGYKVQSFQTGLWENDNQSWYTAVMVREITHMSALAERVVAIAEDIVSLENRLHRLEDQMTDHLRAY